MSKTGAPKPTAEGSLARTPFAHLMQFVLARELSGTLAVWPDDTQPAAGAGQDRVLFRSGMPIAMRSLHACSGLAEGLLGLFSRQRAPYAFYEGQSLLGPPEDLLRDELDPFAVLSLGVRRHASPEQVTHVLRKLGSRPLRLRVGFPIERLHLEPDESRVVELFRKQACDVARAVRASGDDPARAQRVVYLLTLMKGFESVEASERGASVRPPPARPSSPAPASGPPSTAAGTPSWRPPRTPPPVRKLTPSRPPPPAAARTSSDRAPAEAWPEPPDALTEPERALWNEAVERVRQLDHLTHFQLLGVETKATQAEITAAYFALVKRWHPERVPAALQPLRTHIAELFERMTEAHETLTSEEQRLAYIKTVNEGGGTRAAERMMANVVESAMDIQKAEVLLRRRDYAEALSLVERAIERNPAEAGNYALRGWLRLQVRGGDDGLLDEVLADIDRTLADNDRNARAHYYKGVVLKRRGNERAALPHFVRASELDPRHIEAQREVRLARMRRQSIRPAKKPGGLWGKLFSKE